MRCSGAGVAEVMAYLNGCHMPKLFNIKTLVVKFVSCACAVGAGLPVGPEGPMIHIGALVCAAPFCATIALVPRCSIC